MASPIRSHRSLYLLGFALLLSCWVSLAQITPTQRLSERTNTTSGTLTCVPCSLWFPTITVGQAQTQSAKLVNTGWTAVTVLRLYTACPGFSITNLPLPITLAPGQSVQFNVSFKPWANGHVDGSFSLTSTANGLISFQVHGTGISAGVLGASPLSLNFGNVQPGKSATLPETLTNSGGSSVTVSQVKPSGTGFRVSGLSLPLTLAPGQSFTFGAVFAPAGSGSVQGSISVVSNASDPSLLISVSGGGAASGQLNESPASLNFSSVTLGTTKSLPVTLSATGASVTISSATSNSTEYRLSGLTFPLTLAAGQSVSFNLNFTPQSSGTASGTISFVSNASNSPTSESLTGSGTTAPTHSVNLSWIASKSQVIGYNLYRGSVSGGPYTQINPVLDPSTAYTDSTVQGGNTYYYVSTALNSGGIESGFSNQVKVVVPAP
jgi:hypothetical protein